jgi:hypothetical protein
MNEDLQSISVRFETLITMLHKTRNTNGEVDGRGLSIANTHVETAQLWFEDAIKDVELSATSEEPVT